LSIELLLRQFAHEPVVPPVVLSRLPHGAGCAFVITDHSDYDTAEALRVFLHGDVRAKGWLGRGLRLTKGVFALATERKDRPPAACLQDEPYRELVGRLHADGSEVAPHALNESGTVDGETFQETLAEFAKTWRPRTWIDHKFSIQYCYTMGGAEHPDYRLLDALRRNGFRAIWAYHDRPCNAGCALSLLAPPAGEVRTLLTVILRHLLRGHFLISAHYLRSAFRWFLRGRWEAGLSGSLTALRQLVLAVLKERHLRGEDVRRAFQRVCSSFRDLTKEGHLARTPYTRKDLLERGAFAYPERRVPLGQAQPEDLMLFSTAQVTHVRDIYTSEALRQLAADRGVHIGHCYLLNRLPYLWGVFEPGDGEPRLSPDWIRFLDCLSERVRLGEVWNPTMGELAEYVLALQQVLCVPIDATNLRLQNPLPTPLEGVTLLLPVSLAPERVTWGEAPVKGARSWGDWLAVWGDLPARSALVVRLGSGVAGLPNRC
jgi:hypothetical protein